MVAGAAPRVASGCPACAGGGEINGLPCRECAGGRGRSLVPSGVRERLRVWSLAAGGAAGVVAGRLVRWSVTVPGVAGAAGVSWGAAMIAHGVFLRVPELGVAVLVAGVFGLLADRRL